MNANIWALPGFLGLPSDWEGINIEGLRAVDLFSFPFPSLEGWASAFNACVEAQALTASSNWLMGYSLGGRLALHALLEKPALWKGAVIVSAHPGLRSETERQERLKRDEWLAERFESEKWELLMADWNQQAVFAADTFAFKRSEKDFNRKALANLLRLGSLAKQATLHKCIAQLPMPILWIVGEKDERFLTAASEISFAHPKSSLVVLPGASHRLIWSHSALFVHLVQNFIKGI